MKPSNMKLNDGTTSYYFDMSQYIKEAVKNVETYLKEKNLALLKNTIKWQRHNLLPIVNRNPAMDD